MTIEGQADFRDLDTVFWWEHRDAKGNSVMKTPCVYILASKRNGTLYVGVTSDLVRRIWEHKNAIGDGFTKKYKVDRLVYYETSTDMNAAIAREKQLKKWQRAWKLELISRKNQAWEDLWPQISGETD